MNLQIEIQIVNILIDGGQIFFKPNEGITQVAF
jgi:hypothetical protein